MEREDAAPASARPATSGRAPWLVLAASLLLTCAAAALTAMGARSHDNERFENAVQSAGDRIRARLEVYLTALRGAAALFASQDSVAPEAFRRYVDRLDLQRHYPGIQGVGWTVRLRADTSGGAAEAYEIRFLEPLDRRNRAAIGYDMYSDSTRRAAMARARDTGMPAMSGRVRLVQEIFGPEQAGFLLYVPVYEGSRTPPTLATRRARLRGFVYAPFRADDLFAGIFGTEVEPRVSFAVHDGARAESASLLHASPIEPGHRASFEHVESLETAGRRWTVRYASVRGFEEGGREPLVAMIFLAGLVVSTWLFLLARAQSRARSAAEEANRAKSAFLATMSHELRTPLNAIAGYVDLLDMELPGPLNVRQRAYLDRIQRAQHHLLGVINDVLSFAKLEAGHVALQRSDVPVPVVIAEAEALIATQAATAGVRFRDDGGPPVSVRADPEKLRQILINLFTNAVKFTNAGGSVTVRWRAEGGQVSIEVEDTGIGIPPDRLPHIFEPFVQVDADLTRVRQGSGLGLAISAELAHRMGGTLDVRSAVGAGSTFTLSLPAADPGRS
jgi:signal transduction histidine kinase